MYGPFFIILCIFQVGMFSFASFVVFSHPKMDSRYCSVCIQKLLPSFFLENASALPQSKTFVTCYIYREKARERRKRLALQELDSNVRRPPPLRAPLAITPSSDTFRAISRSPLPLRAPIPPVIPPKILPLPKIPPKTPLPLGFLLLPQ